MSTNLFITPKFHASDTNGIPLSGGQVYTYEAGTTTPKTTYSDLAGTVENTNPVILDLYGNADIYFTATETYKIILQDSDNNIIWTEDDLSGTFTSTSLGTAAIVDTGTAADEVPLNSDLGGTAIGDFVKLIDDGSSNGVFPLTHFALDEDDMASDSDIRAATQQSLVAYLSSFNYTPIGTLIIVPTETVPTGYLECNGATISRTTYSELFTVIGTLFGVGDGSTTFEIPDLRGKFLRSWDHGAGNDPGVVSITGDTHSNTTIDSIADTSVLEVGMIITGTGIPTSTTISSIDSGVAITISQAATTTASDVTLTCTDRTDSGDGSTIGDHVGTNQADEFKSHSHDMWRNTGNSANPARSYTVASGYANTISSNVPAFSGGDETRPININLMFCIKYQERG